MAKRKTTGMLDELGTDYRTENIISEAEQKRSFDKRSYRWIRQPANRSKPLSAWILVGCRKGKWRASARKGTQCAVGMKAVKILKPRQKRKPVSRRRRMAANPLMLTLPNPLPRALRNLPKTVLNDPEFRKALKKYEEFHGTMPSSITKHRLPIGGKKKMRSYGIKLGNAPDVTYEADNKNSNKHGSVYLHEYERQVPRVVDASGKVILDVLPRGTKVSDWVHG